MFKDLGSALSALKAFASAIGQASPPEEVPVRSVGSFLPMSLVKGSRGYIEKVASQINECYSRGDFDACAVMCRRIVETAIIEAMEKKGHKVSITGTNGKYYQLGELIDVVLKLSADPQTQWKLGRKCSEALPKLKDLGDRSAHDRRFNAHRHHLNDVMAQIQIVVQELLVLAELK